LVAGALALLATCANTALARGWGRPVAVIAPAPLQIVGTHVAFSSTGQAAVGFGFVDPDRPAGARAWLATLSPNGRSARARRISGARQVLDLAYLNGAFRLLVGADGGARCCALARELTLGRRGLGAQHTLARDLTGLVLGDLVGVGPGMVAAVADAAQLRVVQARSGERFGPVHRLLPKGTAPDSLVAAPLAGRRSLLAWIAGSFAPEDTPLPQTVMLATGTVSRVPGPARTLVTLAAGHAASQLALASGPRASLAWVEDFTDDTGAYQSEVSVAELGSTSAPVSFPGQGTVLAGLSAGADAAGDQLLAWSSCDLTPACQVMAVTRSARGRFGAPVAYGAVDAGAEPAVAVTSTGAAALGWIGGGHVVIAWRRSAHGRFATQRLPGPGYAQNLTLTPGPGGRMLAAWSDGSPRQTLEVSLFTPR
jgi:hypothetical protein